MGSLNVAAAIAPGRGAAGLELGETIGSVRSTIGPVEEWRPGTAGGLAEAVRSTPGWLHGRTGADPGEVLHFGRGMIELHFNAAGALFLINLFDGYRGRLWDEVGIGSPLTLVRRRCELFYDEGDELYYPVGGSPFSGIAFLAGDGPAEEEPLIAGISVHDRSLS